VSLNIKEEEIESEMNDILDALSRLDD